MRHRVEKLAGLAIGGAIRHSGVGRHGREFALESCPSFYVDGYEQKARLHDRELADLYIRHTTMVQMGGLT